MKTKTITIRVTAADIRKGKRDDPFACPVVLAGRRHHLGLYCASYNSLRFRNKPDIPILKKMFAWMRRFDDGQKVKPATFTIEVPQTGAN